MKADFFTLNATGKETIGNYLDRTAGPSGMFTIYNDTVERGSRAGIYYRSSRNPLGANSTNYLLLHEMMHWILDGSETFLAKHLGLNAIGDQPRDDELNSLYFNSGCLDPG